MKCFNCVWLQGGMLIIDGVGVSKTLYYCGNNKCEYSNYLLYDTFGINECECKVILNYDIPSDIDECEYYEINKELN